MSKTTKIILGVFLSFVLLIGGTTGYVMSAKFTAERFEQSILAQDESMQNTWGAMENELKMQGFTVKNYSSEFIKGLETSIKRYSNNKNLLMQMVNESSNSLTPELHKKLMNTIEKVYAKKEARQLSKISVVQEYRTYLKASLKGTLASSIFNYPTDDVHKIMKRIISTKQTKQTWETGNDEVKDPFQ